MKKSFVSFIALIMALCMLSGCAQSGQQPDKSLPEVGEAAEASAAQDSSGIELVSDIATTQYFSDEPVDTADVETILLAGVNAPSAMNGQPWHFSVISDTAVLEQIADGMGGGFGAMPPADFEMPQGAGFVKPEGDGFEPPEAGEFTAPEGFDFPEASDGTNIPEMPEGIPGEAFGADAMPPAGSGAASGGMNKAGLTDAPLAIVVFCKPGSELDAGLACQNMSVAAQLLGYGSKIISSPTMVLNGADQAEYRELLGIPEEMSAVAVLLVGHEDSSVDESMDGYTGASVRNSINDMVSYIG